MSVKTKISTLKTAFVGLGSNLEDPVAQIHQALRELSALPSTGLVARSSLYRSAPVGRTEQPDFVNAVARVATGLSPRELLLALLDIEQRHGRVREFVNAPRTLDLDLLMYEELNCQEQDLILPHPRMHERAFVLLPLTDIAPDCVIPGRGSARALLAACAGQSVEKLEG